MKTATPTPPAYVEVYKMHTHGNLGSIQLKILMDIGREFTEADQSNIRKYAEALHNAITQESAMLSPKLQAQGKEEQEKIISLFKGQEIYVETIPNQYWPDQYGYAKILPWYIITTKLGRIKIGWRKNVISIDWSDSIVKKEASELFPFEDVTKEKCLIHAWGYEKAQHYIDVILTQSVNSK